MAYLDTDGLNALWSKVKAWFGRELSKTEAVDGVTISLKSGSNDTLSSITLNTATTTAAGVMSSAQVTKLAGIAEGAETNQNAFSTIKVGNTNIAADTTTDTLTITAGNQISISPDASTDTLTINHAATHTAATAAAKKVGMDTYGHVVLGDALTASDVGAAASSHTHSADDITTGTLPLTRGGTGTTFGDEGAGGVVYVNIKTQQKMSVATPAQIVSALGTTPVNRATADASGNTITTTYAPINNPDLQGTPTAPTATTGTSTTQIATTEFVANSISAMTAGVSGVKGNAEATYRTGDVNITPANIGVEDGAEVNQNAFSNVKVGATTMAADTKTDTLEIAGGTNITVTPDATNDKVTITHGTYDTATAAAVKVGRDATGHVVIGNALTASDVGAAASSHNHNASDINAGTLGVAHGGTGVNTLGAGVVYHNASGTGALSIATGANIVSAIGNNAVTNATNATNASNSTTQATGTNNTTIATTAFVQQEIAAAQTGAAMYQGTLANEAAFTALTDYKAGYYWVVSTAWDSASLGIHLDKGDMIFCNTNYTSAFSASHFDVISVDIEAIPVSYIQALS